MIPINNSDTAWLIVSDYNQDNGIGYPDVLRDDILNHDSNDWQWEDYCGLHTVSIIAGDVGGSTENYGVGGRFGQLGGCSGSDMAGGIGCGHLIGGHYSIGHL